MLHAPRSGPLPMRAMLAACAASLALLAGCGTPPSSPSQALSTASVAHPGAAAFHSRCGDWLAARQRGAGELYRLDEAASRLRVHVFRAGRLAAMGHNHVLGLARLQGQAFVPAQGLEGAGVELGFRLDDLEPDRAEWRAELGPEFASRPTESDIAGTKANLLRALQAQAHPRVLLQSTAVAGAWPWLALRVSVQLNGQLRESSVPLKAWVQAPAGQGGGTLHAQGRMLLRQSEFGIQPFSVLGGLLAVQDELVMDFELVGRPAEACVNPSGMSPGAPPAAG